MSRYVPPRHPFLGLLLLALLLAPSLSLGEIFTIDEDFSNTARRDSALTSAFWDTMALNVHLRSQILFSRGDLNTTSAYTSVRGPSHLFLADGTAGLRSIDLNDPDNPLSVDSVDCIDQAKGVALSGDHAFVAAGSAGLQVIDISNPAAMIDGGYFDNGGDLNYLNAVAVSNPAVYLAESGLGVAVFNITNPAQPVFVRHVDTGTWARDVFVSGNQLLVVDENLVIFDLSDPLDPVQVSQTPVIGTALRVSVSGSRAFVACGTSGLQIFDISDATEPVAIGSLDVWDSCQHAVATAGGDTVFVAASSQGLSLLDATDPAAMSVLGSRDTITPALHVTYHDSLIHLANGSNGLKVFEIDPFGLDPENNRAQSTNLNDSGDPVSRISLSASVSDSVFFEVTANGGANWFALEPGSGWFEFPTAGTDVRWRAFLTETAGSPTGGPACHGLTLTMDRLASHAVISSVTDVPADTGLQVRLAWFASRHDATGADYQVTEYSIYRRFQDDDAKSSQPSAPYPPGQWDFVTTVPADMESEYATVVPTLADSNQAGIFWSVYFVRTRTSAPGVFFDSPPDSGFSVNNLQPAAPTGFMVDYSPTDGTQLNWNPTLEPRFAHFRLYRSLQPNSPVGPATLFAVTTDTEHFDTTATIWHYQLTQVTLDGQESQPAGQLSALPDHSAKLRLLPNTPNPFNPNTLITFLVAETSSPVFLEIFDARGHKTRTLLDHSLSEGWHTANWNGKDDAGRTCASGVYHARLRQGQRRQIMKMTLVR
jgi:hypothetical protein